MAKAAKTQTRTSRTQSTAEGIKALKKPVTFDTGLPIPGRISRASEVFKFLDKMKKGESYLFNANQWSDPRNAAIAFRTYAGVKSWSITIRADDQTVEGSTRIWRTE